jgi:hypothetical protein
VGGSKNATYHQSSFNLEIVSFVYQLTPARTSIGTHFPIRLDWMNRTMGMGNLKARVMIVLQYDDRMGQVTRPCCEPQLRKYQIPVPRVNAHNRRITTPFNIAAAQTRLGEGEVTHMHLSKNERKRINPGSIGERDSVVMLC